MFRSISITAAPAPCALGGNVSRAGAVGMPLNDSSDDGPECPSDVEGRAEGGRVMGGSIGVLQHLSNIRDGRKELTGFDCMGAFRSRS
jgi:hypothetical protein